MKAEHRKELQTNTLADSLGRLVQGIKGKPSPNALVIWIFLGLALVVFAGWKFFSGNTLEKRSKAWTELEDVSSMKEVADFAEAHPKTIAGLIARFQQARVLEQQGLLYLYDSFTRTQALKNVEAAETIYTELAKDKDTAADPILLQEAFMGIAKAREARGDLDGALEYYTKLAEQFPKSALGQAAAEQKKQLDANPDAKAFYAKMNELAAKPLITTPTPDALPDWLR